ncbi:hypothetical protein Bbelb_202630 [Branchiostoma belcheri]|nr:hypothetical protein Bbelb_202630 [Branchiostoma belcheri]
MSGSQDINRSHTRARFQPIRVLVTDSPYSPSRGRVLGSEGRAEDRAEEERTQTGAERVYSFPPRQLSSDRPESGFPPLFNGNSGDENEEVNRHEMNGRGPSRDVRMIDRSAVPEGDTKDRHVYLCVDGVQHQEDMVTCVRMVFSTKKTWLPVCGWCSAPRTDNDLTDESTQTIWFREGREAMIYV